MVGFVVVGVVGFCCCWGKGGFCCGGICCWGKEWVLLWRDLLLGERVGFVVEGFVVVGERKGFVVGLNMVGNNSSEGRSQKEI